jgi:hypothetical protein
MRSYKPRSFLLVAEDEVTSNPGFPVLLIRSSTYQIQYCSGEVALKHPALIPPSQTTPSSYRSNGTVSKCATTIYFPASLNIKQESTFWLPWSGWREDELLNPALQNEAEMEKHASVLQFLRPARTTCPHCLPTLSPPRHRKQNEIPYFLLLLKGVETQKQL